MIYSFHEQLAYSRGVREATDLQTIAALIPGCVSVTKTDVEQDRAGIDYVAILRKGARILIDAKTRTRGCGRHWKQGPELALETWSVLPDERNKGKVGWTLCEAKEVDYILFTFDPADSNEVFLYPFQLLRIAFVNNLNAWYRKYKVDTQDSGRWKSRCVFVPESIAWDALRVAMRSSA